MFTAASSARIALQLTLLGSASMLMTPAAWAQTADPNALTATENPSPTKVMLRGGFAYLNWDDRSAVSVGGQLVPGGNGSLSNNNGIAFDVAYFFNPNVSVALALGIPPTTTLSGAGSLAFAGKLGKITYGPAAVTTRYHFTGLGPVVPYLGGGINYTLVFNTKDRFLQNLHVDNAVGPVITGGADIFISKRFGIFVDAKKIWASSHARFLVPSASGLVPGAAKTRLDPLVLNAGVSFRF